MNCHDLCWPQYWPERKITELHWNIFIKNIGTFIASFCPSCFLGRKGGWECPMLFLGCDGPKLSLLSPKPAGLLREFHQYRILGLPNLISQFTLKVHLSQVDSKNCILDTKIYPIEQKQCALWTPTCAGPVSEETEAHGSMAPKSSTPVETVLLRSIGFAPKTRSALYTP